MAAAGEHVAAICRALRVTGQVQGVGFRPFVYRLAVELGLGGSVRNDPAGVKIRLVGEAARVEEFLRRLPEEAPALARIDSVREVGGARGGRDRGFVIETSEVGSDGDPGVRGRLTVDAATCADCAREIRDPGDRRYRYGLANCTACGPRYSIVRDLPFDRSRTTMAAFPLCAKCRAEYEDPADRRFHAQPVCCPECGPRVSLTDRRGTHLEGDPYRAATAILAGGGILAMKGVGGYHLVADALDAAAVARLRREKRRDAKPLAVMVADLAAARELTLLSAAGARELASPAAPIVLAPARFRLAPGVNGPSHRTGVMLPGSPMQHLLLAAAGGPLVMTSGNLSDDPLVTGDAAARERLRFADAFLSHDRPIERAVDDSVLIDGPGGLVPVRRARGYAPAPIRLPVAAPVPGLAAGGDRKSVLALVAGAEAVLSPHLGDLDHALALRRFERTIDDLGRLCGIRPEFFAVDLHPDYLSSRSVARRARAAGRTVIPVQHHHAHLASLLAEHGRADRILALALDGVGYGTDTTAWGGEVLAGDLLDATRLGRLRPLRLPGGDAAAREIGRCALAWLADSLGPDAAVQPAAGRAEPDPGRRATIFAMLAAGLASPPSSGAGRLFDAAAALLGLADANRFEAESGMALEAAAARATERPEGSGALPAVAWGGGFELDTRPLLPALLGVHDARGPAAAAWFFHDALADGFAVAARRARKATGIGTVGLTGGVFLNQLFAERLRLRLLADGFTVLLHERIPPGDGGIALGQAAVAAARLARGR